MNKSTNRNVQLPIPSALAQLKWRNAVWKVHVRLVASRRAPSSVCTLATQFRVRWTHAALSVFTPQVLHQTFPQHTFLMNGLIHGVKVTFLDSWRAGSSHFLLSCDNWPPESALKQLPRVLSEAPDQKWSPSPSSLLFSQGLLSFLSAPLIGALSDVWGRKSFLLLTVFFTCAPIPLMKISPW